MGEDQHSDQTIGFQGAVWSEGYMSPGGPNEVAKVLEGLDLTGKTVLGVGSGAGGVVTDMVRRRAAGRVVGIDVEVSGCAAARTLVERKGLSNQIEILYAVPGPWPREDASVDLVFSKDSIIHIADKEWLAREAMRMLRPGCCFAASDWLISHDGPPSPAMADHITAESLDFTFASPGSYERALKAAGLEEIELDNRNLWYQEEARAELEAMKGKNRAALEAAFGTEDLESNIAIWEKMVKVIETGEHCPHHLRGRKQ